MLLGGSWTYDFRNVNPVATSAIEVTGSANIRCGVATNVYSAITVQSGATCSLSCSYYGYPTVYAGGELTLMGGLLSMFHFAPAMLSF